MDLNQLSSFNLDHLIDIMPDATFMINNDNKVLHWNIQMEKMTGVVKDRVLNSTNYNNYLEKLIGSKISLASCLLMNDLDLAKEVYGTLIFDIETDSYLTHIRTITGDYIYIIASLIYDESNNIIGAIQFMRNITEHMNKIFCHNQLEEDYNNAIRTLEQTVNVLSQVVNFSDPYTGSHQIGVANLCNEVCTQLQLEDDLSYGITTAALIHDIGKIGISQDILVKPTKLIKQEFELIKLHPSIGYEIINNISFKEPIAIYVQQHHELLDGTGYPHNLRENEILFGSKVLVVCDVVEAISSHRPYRPSLGMSFAIEYISKWRGIKYDNDVVDACITAYKQGKLKGDAE